jgi:hypothetical protein
MIRTAQVMGWLRWRLLINLLKPTRKRDTLERASRAIQVLGPLVLFLIFIPAVILAGFAGGLAGFFLTQSGGFHRPILSILRAALMFEIFLTVLAPLLRAAQGSTPNLARFLLLPIPVRDLYVTEALGALADPWMAILASAALFLPLGMILAGEVAAAGVALLAGAGLLMFLSGLGTLFASLASLVFRDRKRGELATFILMASLAILGFLPGLLATLEPVKRHLPDARKIEAQTGRAPTRGPANVDGPGWSGRAVPAWALAYPPELFVRSVAQGADHRARRALLPLAALLLWTAGIHAIGARTYRRLLETPEVSSPRRRARAGMVFWPVVPGISPAASAIAISQVRLVFRTVQGKIQTCILPLVILVMGILWLRRSGELAPAGFPFPVGLLLATFGIFLALLTLEGTLLNQFAMDRAGLTLEFLAPISDRDLILGKAAAGAILAASRAIPCVLIAAILAPGGSIFLWLSLPMAGLALLAVMTPLGAILSTLLPRPVDPGRLAKQNQPHPVAALLGMLGNLLALGPIAALGFAGVFLLHSPAMALLLVSLWTGVVLLISIPLMRLAERFLASRRENLALVAQGR